jgi:7-cyano-7-deazaguanine reductase
MTFDIHQLPLGKQTQYISTYTPSLLVGIPRKESRNQLGIVGDALPFQGVDIWNAYEISWLNANGKPEVAFGEFRLSCATPNIIESKSFKLYLNSFNQTKFNNWNDVTLALETDLSAVAGAPVLVQLTSLTNLQSNGVGMLVGQCIDGFDIEVDCYHPNSQLLSCVDSTTIVHEALHSHLLKSNCPVTNQPDWGSVVIQYSGKAIDRESLLRYIISFRQHNEFHEHCVEQMFVDILKQCEPEKLTIYARYLRRGGLDINPFRTNCGDTPENVRLARQ